jgi:hypothetical protein
MKKAKIETDKESFIKSFVLLQADLNTYSENSAASILQIARSRQTVEDLQRERKEKIDRLARMRRRWARI